MKKKKGKKECPALFLAGEPTDCAGCMCLGVFCYVVIFVWVVGTSVPLKLTIRIPPSNAQ